MYLDAMEFLDEEHEAWTPFQVLADLSDAELGTPVEAAHGWSGRDLMAHMLAWQAVALDVARELAVGETSPTIARVAADWDTRGGEVVNDEIQSGWAARPLDELRSAFRSQPGELRGTLTVVPEARWVKHPTHMETLQEETVAHYRDHEADLAAILRGRRAMTLDELLEAAAEELGGVTRRAADGGVQFLTGDQLIAVLGPDGAAEFRLDPAVAAAARRTPDTEPSTRGPEWVRFTPTSLDGHAADRAVAWLGSAARRAVG